MRGFILACIVAVASAQNGDVARRQITTETDLFQLSIATQNQLSTLQSQLSANNQEIAQLSAMLAQAAAMAQAQRDGAVDDIMPTTNAILNMATDMTVDSATNDVMITGLAAAASSLDATITRSANTVNQSINDVTSGINSDLSSMATEASSAMAAMTNTVNSTINTQVASVLSQVTSTIQPLGALRNAMLTSHFMSPSTPFYRWMSFHVFSNNNIGWFDGNNVRHFGGRNPSNWGDGNANVYEMDPNFSAIARLFTRRGVGSPDGSGAAVCMETWYLYSSTDTKYCLALFRIQNTGTSPINYPGRWYGTGWQGWGNWQSATLNGIQNWSGDCQWFCTRAITWQVPGSSTSDRISTLIYANGQSYPVHFGNNHHIITTYLAFDQLALPNGLRYVDDMDTVTGRWR